MSTAHRGIVVTCDTIVTYPTLGQPTEFCPNTFEAEAGLDEVEAVDEAMAAGWASNADGEFCPTHANAQVEPEQLPGRHAQEDIAPDLPEGPA